ncbi:hypothetical protein [Elizabethkingia meningoseptica]|uniref:hypothetical protein n=1 Tax=Elizabethkingia meningoseptica TaxID=238 RepID=UPI0038921D83
MFNFSEYDNIYREKYLLFKSNIRKYLLIENPERLFSELINIPEQENHVIKNFDWNTEINISQPSQCIYVTMHLGPYKTIIASIISNAINLCIPVTEYIYINKKGEYMKGIESIKEKVNGNISIVNIETREGLSQLIKNIRNGYSVLLYLDGNSGFGGMERDDDKLIKITFFKQTIYVRKGAYKLAHLLKLSIIPVVSFFNTQGTPQIEYLNDWKTDIINQSEVDVMQQLWEIYEKYISLYKGQWEAWTYANIYSREQDISKNKKQNKNISNTNLLIFNSQRFDFIIDNDKYFIYDLLKNIKYKVPKTLFDFFNKINKEKIILTKTAFFEIIKKENLAHDILEKELLY